jgi:hypothetical protein
VIIRCRGTGLSTKVDLDKETPVEEMTVMLEWTPEAIEADIARRNELRLLRDAQGIVGRPTPLPHRWTRGLFHRHHPDDKSSRKAS